MQFIIKKEWLSWNSDYLFLFRSKIPIGLKRLALSLWFNWSRLSVKWLLLVGVSKSTACNQSDQTTEILRILATSEKRFQAGSYHLCCTSLIVLMCPTACTSNGQMLEIDEETLSTIMIAVSICCGGLSWFTAFSCILLSVLRRFVMKANRLWLEIWWSFKTG
jgi:hypothetical protein